MTEILEAIKELEKLKIQKEGETMAQACNRFCHENKIDDLDKAGVLTFIPGFDSGVKESINTLKRMMK